MIRRIPILIVVHILLLSCHPRYVKQNESYHHFSLKENSASVLITDSITRFKKAVDAETSRIIGVTTGEITKDGHETTLGNFVCDALRYDTLAFPGERYDVVIVNRGGLRANLPEGELRVRNIFELMPFENELVLLSIKGEDLLQFVPHVVEKKHAFYGLKIKVAAGEAVSAVFVNGDKIDPEKYYKVITSDYLAKGGDSFTFLNRPKYQKNSGLKIRDVIIGYCDYLTKNKKQIIPYKDGRLEISK